MPRGGPQEQAPHGVGKPCLSLSLSYDTENKEIGDGSHLLRVVFEIRF